MAVAPRLCLRTLLARTRRADAGPAGGITYPGRTARRRAAPATGDGPRGAGGGPSHHERQSAAEDA
eukprot:21231-Pyramimonas_sp.AAC.1